MKNVFKECFVTFACALKRSPIPPPLHAAILWHVITNEITRCMHGAMTLPSIPAYLGNRYSYYVTYEGITDPTVYHRWDKPPLYRVSRWEIGSPYCNVLLWGDQIELDGRGCGE